SSRTRTGRPCLAISSPRSPRTSPTPSRSSRLAAPTSNAQITANAPMRASCAPGAQERAVSGGFKPRSDTHGPSIRTSPDPAHHAEFGLRERRRSRPGPAWGCHSLTGFEDLLVRLTMLSAVRVRKCVRGAKLTHRFLHVTMAAGTVTLAIIGRDKELD